MGCEGKEHDRIKIMMMRIERSYVCTHAFLDDGLPGHCTSSSFDAFIISAKVPKLRERLIASVLLTERILVKALVNLMMMVMV